MDLLLSLLSLFLLAAAGHAASSSSSPQLDYWRSVFPNTPMPSAISDHIASPDALAEEKSGTSVSVGYGGVHVGTGKPGGGGTTVNVGHGGVHVGTGKPGGGGTTVNVGHGGVHVGTGKPGGGGTNVHAGPGGVHVGTGYKKGKPVIVRVGPNFNYLYAATETQIHDDPSVAFFFLEKDLHPGATMNLHFTKATSGASFVTKKEADSIPFSSDKLPEILGRFSVAPGSDEAKAMKTTLHECELPAVRGEKRYCATSLESMVEFTFSTLGTRDVAAASTAVSKAGTPRQRYTITDVKATAGDKLVACQEAYAYAVFYCHATATTKAYTVRLAGADGTVVEAAAVCHTDTKAWNPNHLAFKVLKVKPGTVPVCHFLPEDHLVWSRRG
ncbi:BURP domain-containing protein 3-like [Canna indica]|uniref:BURP domain-containing protein 3-like n=1 Tax=Canna indica TaxID=4628 RepID=A0AAQ3JYH5_9LILI|nr:BURP domain-containing protein 3-like [Canna indica]